MAGIDQFSGSTNSESKLIFPTGMDGEFESLKDLVRLGEADFIADLKKHGLDTLGIETSTVHAYNDLEKQALVIALPSVGRPDEVRRKSYLTYAAHWIDDFMDDPQLVQDPEALFANRKDIRSALGAMGNPGKVGFLMAQKSEHPEAVLKGLHRVLYGGLIQRSSERSQREQLLREYSPIGADGLDTRLARDILKLRPAVYLTTNKVVFEIFNSTEEGFNPNVSELWNLIYAPALYFHDIHEEEKRGQSNATPEERPTVAEMAEMIRMTQGHLREIPDPRQSLRFKQLRVLNEMFRKVLPSEIIEAYRDILQTA